MTDLRATLDLDGARGAKIRKMFAALEDPTPALLDFGEFKRRQLVLSMPRLPRLTRSTPGQPPARRSGLLSQRITYDVEGLRLDVGTNDVRAKLLHFGGTVRPVRAKFLAVPVHPDAQGKRPADFDLDLVPRKGRPSLLVRKVMRGKSGETRRLDVMFVLLKSVRIAARPWLLWRKEADEKYLLKALQRQFEEGAK